MTLMQTESMMQNGKQIWLHGNNSNTFGVQTTNYNMVSADPVNKNCTALDARGNNHVCYTTYTKALQMAIFSVAISGPMY